MTTVVGTPPGVTASGYRVPPPITPGVVPGLIGWFDADDATTFTFITGAQINQWRDKSLLNNHANTHGGAGAFAPSLVPAAMNGKPAVSFLPSGCIATAIAGDIKPFHIIVAVKTPASVSGTSLIGGGNGEPAGYINLDDPGSATLRLMRYSHSLVGAATSAYTLNALTTLAVSYDAAGVWTHYRNGVQVGTGTNNVTFTAGCHLALGGGSAPNNGMWTGYAGEFIIYNRVLTGGERAGLDAYCRTKWGTP